MSEQVTSIKSKNTFFQEYVPGSAGDLVNPNDYPTPALEHPRKSLAGFLTALPWMWKWRKENRYVSCFRWWFDKEGKLHSEFIDDRKTLRYKLSKLVRGKKDE